MANIANMTVRSRLALSFGILTFMVLIVCGLALRSLDAANARFESFVRGINARAQVAEQIRNAADRRAIAARDILFVNSPADVATEQAEAMSAHRVLHARLKQLQDLLASRSDTSEKARQLVRDIANVEDMYGPVALAIIQAGVNNRRDDAVKLIDEQCRPLLASLIKATDAYGDYAKAYATVKVADSNRDFSRQRMMLAGICLLAVLSAVIAGLLITRSLTRALGAEPGELGELTRRVAQGDLRPVAGSAGAPEGSILASISAMQVCLVELISQVRDAADSIATGSSEIATGNTELSSRTEQQAASLQETASAMEQLTSTVNRNAETAQQARALAASASEVAHRGSEVVGQVIGTIEAISEGSTRVAEITGIIESIAFQTNILALNAAVEAARAGEQGRGFAVVASEVRSLAQRSSVAAREIKELISASVSRIQDGATLATQAGHTMSEVTHAVARVTDLMGEIATASIEQSRGIGQVNVAVTQMDSVTQQNAALVEEAAAASQSLEEQGRQLLLAIGSFQLDQLPLTH